MKLLNRVEKEYRQTIKLTGTLFNYRMWQLGQKIEDAGKAAVGIVADKLSMVPELNYTSATSSGALTQIEYSLKAIFNHTAHEAGIILETVFDEMDLSGRLVTAFFARKTTPPWETVKLNFADELPRTGSAPRKAQLIYHFVNLSNGILQNVSRGLLNGESLNDIVKRVRLMFPRQPKYKEESSYRDLLIRSLMREEPIDTWSETKKIFNKPPVNIEFGIFSFEDVTDLQDAQKKAMGWEHRQYRPWFSEELKSANRYLRDLERDLNYTANSLLHDGMLQIGGENLGIQDFVWIASKGHPCDECDARDGKTMTQIEDEFNDDTPPALHPNCNCQLVPKIRDDWAKETLSNGQAEWDLDEGLSFKATDAQKDLGFDDMSWDQWLENVRAS